ncbi:protoporphyrinogen oxidase HemJ [Aliidiomarina soli]|uniref:Protoporphyrinogen IX oxidase n=1 Tax=Aliidiomarina soli TaxID=1928574 RepID=A0A432WDS4_9GAMM|nr:protoporphyrinogen oxidase HemJ [Aliidiomarina soli]RUO31033.1 protoporphyrinogen oxidase HemJ [Aliidiomarina soli]
MNHFLLQHYDWLKALHIIFMVAWFAGIFYLPRIFVYHAETSDSSVQTQLKVMQRRLLFFVTPFALLTLIFGLLMTYALSTVTSLPVWLHIKFALVALLYIYHGYCFRLLRTFANDANTRSGKWYRVFNEIPVLILFTVVLLAVIKPW